MLASVERNREASGFDGVVTGLGLADLVQLLSQVRLTGSVSIRSGDRFGAVYLHEGQLVHAAHDRLSGEAAFYEIMTWRTGAFVVNRGVTTTQWTIRRPCCFLLLESQRRLDERWAERTPARAVAR